MSYTGFVTTLKNVRPHSNADRMQLADCFGNTVCVDLSYKEGDVVVYFPTDGQLSEEFCKVNDLVRRKDENGKACGGYLDPNKRNIRTLTLRGEKSDGLAMPLSAFDYCFEDSNAAAHLKVGETITMLNGHEICKKFVPAVKTSKVPPNQGNRTRKKKTPIAPLFQEHADTEQLAYNMSDFKSGDQIEITLKMHGTSQRTGYLPMLKEHIGPKWAFDAIGRKGLYRFIKPSQKTIESAEKALTPVYDWGYVTGTRRTVLDSFDGGFYGSNEFREKHAKEFEGKLWKGETVYYEVVGFTDDGGSIMGDVSNSKLKNALPKEDYKEFVKQYGDTTVFSYGCSRDGSLKSDFYVYRMTMTNEDGDVVEYTPDFMRYRCEQMGVKTVPVFWKGYVDETIDWNDAGMTAGEWVKNTAEKYYDGTDPIGKTHVREGVVVRIINRPKFAAYKHKNFNFKVLEGIIKEVAEAPDMEEADGLE